jgi:hypothetical protein
MVLADRGVKPRRNAVAANDYSRKAVAFEVQRKA